MQTQRVKDISPFLSPTSSEWIAISSEQIKMMPTPVAMQPTEYIRNSWEGKEYGKVSSVDISTVHDGESWALRAEWEGVSPDGMDFPDALAIALPVRGNPVLMLMGGVDSPIQFLRWQSNKTGAFAQIATGIGLSTKKGPDLKCSAESHSENDRWTVVVSRELATGGDIAPLLAGETTKIGFAIWNGGNDERGGIKAFSIDWAELILDK